MTPIPLEQIGLYNHRSALWWLILLYQKPYLVRKALEDMPKGRALLAGGLLYLHALPYLLIVAFIGRLLLALALGDLGGLDVIELIIQLARVPQDVVCLECIKQIAFDTIIGISFGVPVGIAVAILGRLARRVFLGISLGITLGIILGITFGMFLGLVGTKFWRFLGYNLFGVVGTILLVIPFVIVSVRLWVIVWKIVVAVFLRIIHSFFIWPRAHGRWYPRHPVALLNSCAVSFPGLDRLLLAYAECDEHAALREIERLINHCPIQRMAALRARCSLIARSLAKERDLGRLGVGVAKLPEGDEGFLRLSPTLRDYVGEISHLQQRLNTQIRPYFQVREAELLCVTIENFMHRIVGFPEPLGNEFRAAADCWLDVARQQLRGIKVVVDQKPLPQVFRAGDPVVRDKEAFVCRNGVLGELDRQLMLSASCPGLILYGRRRMGKTTVLTNLEGFLPGSVGIVFISMDEPQAFTAQTTFIRRIADGIAKSWPEADAPRLVNVDFIGFNALLDECDQRLAKLNRKLLLALDEYETLDHKIGAGVFKEDLLAMLRESIQKHRHLIWLFAGSHRIDELTNAPWASYLISVRTVEVLPFTEQETYTLLTDPLQYSRCWSANDRERPRFTQDVWGQDGINCIHQEAGGWPHLVQLLAETTVDILNDSGLRMATPALLDQAIAKAIIAGENVLRQLLYGESSESDRTYLRGFRAHDEQAPPEDDAVYQSLKRRLLVSEDNGRWRLRIPLMLRWLRERG